MKDLRSAWAILQEQDRRSISFDMPIAIEAVMVRARKRRLNVATIDTFKKFGSYEFAGEILILSVQAKNVRVVPNTCATT